MAIFFYTLVTVLIIYDMTRRISNTRSNSLFVQITSNCAVAYSDKLRPGRKEKREGSN